MSNKWSHQRPKRYGRHGQELPPSTWGLRLIQLLGFAAGFAVVWEICRYFA